MQICMRFLVFDHLKEFVDFVQDELVGGFKGFFDVFDLLFCRHFAQIPFFSHFNVEISNKSLYIVFILPYDLVGHQVDDS